MMATRRLAAILATDVVGYSRLMGEDEAGREHREAAHPITLNANYGFPPTAISTVTIFNDQCTSTPAGCAPIPVVSRRLAGRIILTGLGAEGMRQVQSSSN